jgi:hypothetical protein
MGEKDINTELWQVIHLEDGEGNRRVKKVAEVKSPVVGGGLWNY